MQEIRWGMIGCGDVTEKKSGPAFNQILHSKLVAVMSRTATNAADYARRHDVPKWYDDADALLNDPEVNAIYIATPPNSHHDYTLRALRLGKPVYVEKPMALDADACNDMVQVSEFTGVPLFVAYYRRALPYFLKVKELVDSRVIGDIRLVNIALHWPPKSAEKSVVDHKPWRVDPAVAGGGNFHDLASHQFDFLDFVLGPMQEARGLARNQAGWYEADDAVMAAFEFESGVLGTGSWCFTGSESARLDETYFLGSKGKIIFSFFERFTIRVEIEDQVETYELPYPSPVQQPLIETVVAALRGEGTCPSTGKSAARASQILDWISGI